MTLHEHTHMGGGITIHSTRTQASCTSSRNGQFHTLQILGPNTNTSGLYQTVHIREIRALRNKFKHDSCATVRKFPERWFSRLPSRKSLYYRRDVPTPISCLKRGHNNSWRDGSANSAPQHARQSKSRQQCGCRTLANLVKDDKVYIDLDLQLPILVRNAIIGHTMGEVLT